jgi:hypothetical protein
MEVQIICLTLMNEEKKKLLTPLEKVRKKIIPE